jgi:hypothetical protein
MMPAILKKPSRWVRILCFFKGHLDIGYERMKPWFLGFCRSEEFLRCDRCHREVITRQMRSGW